MALKLMATAGVCVVAASRPNIRKLTDSTFMAAFVAKGRLPLRQIPVRIIMNDKVALLGAARCVTLQAS
jgi:glucokinase